MCSQPSLRIPADLLLTLLPPRSFKLVFMVSLLWFGASACPETIVYGMKALFILSGVMLSVRIYIDDKTDNEP